MCAITQCRSVGLHLYYATQGFNWAKTVGGMPQVMVRALKKVDQLFVLTMAAYNLVRLAPWGKSIPWRRNERNSGRKYSVSWMIIIHLHVGLTQFFQCSISLRFCCETA